MGQCVSTINAIYDARRVITLLTLVANFCVAVAFLLTAFDVVGRCVTEPCVAETAGLLRVNSGMSFGLLLSGFLFVLQPVYGLWFFRARRRAAVPGASSARVAAATRPRPRGAVASRGNEPKRWGCVGP